jgi:hypothetical protein
VLTIAALAPSLPVELPALALAGGASISCLLVALLGLIAMRRLTPTGAEPLVAASVR